MRYALRHFSGFASVLVVSLSFAGVASSQDNYFDYLEIAECHAARTSVLFWQQQLTESISAYSACVGRGSLSARECMVELEKLNDADRDLRNAAADASAKCDALGRWVPAIPPR